MSRTIMGSVCCVLSATTLAHADTIVSVNQPTTHKPLSTVNSESIATIQTDQLNSQIGVERYFSTTKNDSIAPFANTMLEIVSGDSSKWGWADSFSVESIGAFDSPTSLPEDAWPMLTPPAADALSTTDGFLAIMNADQDSPYQPKWFDQSQATYEVLQIPAPSAVILGILGVSAVCTMRSREV